MMATLGFGSEFPAVESVLGAFSDEFSSQLKDKKLIVFRVCAIVIAFLLGLPMVSRVC
jgi:hypothetical protein